MPVPIEKYQVAGLDERERGFNRMTEIEQIGNLYQATFRYETVHVRTGPSPTVSMALEELIRLLHEQGYRQLRSRLSFRVETYLGSQELWTEHPDPIPAAGGHRGWQLVLNKLTEWFGSRTARIE
jgi:hypothetical protein